MRINREKTLKLSAMSLVVGFCLMIVVLILYGINQFRVGSQLATINQVSHLSHLLVRQQSNLFSLMLAKNAKRDELIEALDNFAKEALILDAQLYTTNGTLLAKSSQSVSFQMTKARESDQVTQQIVEPVFVQNELSGFLRVTFDAEYRQTTRHKINALFHTLYGELIVLFLAGGLLVSCFYVFGKPNLYIVYSKRKPQPHQAKRQTQRFHSRRRTLGRKSS